MAFANIVPFDPKTKTVNVIIETPKGSRNKYAYDPVRGVIVLSRILPLGTSFPFDFGFIPQTKAADGDPLDALVLLDEPVFPGCLVECRALGIIVARQTEAGKTTRNDRVIATSLKSVAFKKIAKLGDLNPTIVEEIRRFFSTYHEIQGRKFRPLRNLGPGAAYDLIAAARVSS